MGGLVLEELLRAPQYERVTALVRRRLPRDHAKLRQVLADFERLERAGEALAADDAFCCLGTTRAKAGGADAFRRVDFDGVQVFRPSLLLGPRAESRPFERVSGALMTALRPLIPPRWRAIRAASVARAMVRWALAGKTGVNRLDNERIEELGREI